jgi:hypothetical protein
MQHAGGRVWSGPVGKEVWAKPLQPGVVAVVLLNRYGTAVGNFQEPQLPHGGIPTAFAPYPGCYITNGDSMLSPCDDNLTATSGAQQLTLDYSVLPAAWLGLPSSGTGSVDGGGGDGRGGKSVSCDLFDILATTHAGAALGHHPSGWSATVPPHGVRFLRLENCTLV